MFNNNKIQITNYGILSEKVSSAFTIAHLSDLHEKSFGLHNHQLFHKIRAVEPDIIAVTGDMIAHERQKDIDVKYLENFAAGIAKIAPCFFVTGNHEKNFSPSVETIMQRHGVVVLKEQIETLNIRGTKVLVSGMDDSSFENADPTNAAKVFNGKDGYSVFLAHRPEHFETYMQHNIDLVLTGHTHAGQIRFPGIGTFAMSGQGLFPKYVQGEFYAGGTTMIISRGLGSSGYPKIRINNPPELVAVTVQPQENSGGELE